MELNTTLDLDRTTLNNHLILFNSVGGNLPKSLGFANYINLDINQSRQTGNESPTPIKVKDFLPYLHERDKLNCLLTVSITIYFVIIQRSLISMILATSKSLQILHYITKEKDLTKIV